MVNASESKMKVFIIVLIAVKNILTTTQNNDSAINLEMILSVADHYDVNWIIFYRLLESAQNVTQMLSESRHQHKAMAVYDAGGGRCCEQLNFINKLCRIKWLVLTKQATVNVSSMFIPFNCQFVLGQSSSGRDEYSLSELYQISSPSKLHMQCLGTWDSNRGLNLTHETFSDRRANLHREEIVVRPLINDHSGSASTFLPDYVPGIWEAIRSRLNATATLTNDTSKCDIDVNVIPPGLDGQLLPVMLRIKSGLYYREGSSQYVLTRYFDPFSRAVWLGMMFWLVISAFAMFVVSQCSSRVVESRINFLIDGFYVYLQQGSQLPVNSLSSASVQALQLFLSFFLFAFYSGVFISFITVTISAPPFTTLEGILQDGRYNIVTLENKGYRFFKHSRPGVIRDLFLERVEPLERQPKTFPEAFTRVCNNREKLLVECGMYLAPTVMKSLPSSCRISKHTIPLTVMKWQFFMPFGNRFQKIVKPSIIKLMESGALGDLFFSKAVMKTESESETLRSISITEVSSLFLFFLFGIILSVCILMFELFCPRKTSKKNKVRICC